jgi:hypothetical protein
MPANLCPKHNRPFVRGICRPCRIESRQKPPQAPPIAVVPPVRADATPVKRSQIPPDVRRKIEDSLATAPRITSEPTVTAVETSSGLKIVNQTEATDLADDATSTIDRQKKSRLPAAPKRQPSRPSYLKSVAQPVVPSADPAAPFGRDDNYRPITPGRTDQEMLRDLLAKDWVAPGPDGPCNCNQPLCKHCHPENIAQTDVLRFGAERRNSDVQVDLEESVRRQLGVWKSAPVSRPIRKFDYFPEILGISRGALFYLLLNGRVGTEVIQVKTGTVTKALKSSSKLALQIKGLIAGLESAKLRILELKRLIAESEKLIESWSVRVMKLRRAEDNILDKPTREKFKREEKKKIEQYENEKRELESRLRKSNVEELQQRLAKWGSSPDDYDNVEAVETQELPVMFKEKFKEPQDEIKDISEEYRELLQRRVSKIDSYITLLSLPKYEGLQTLCRRHPLMAAWRYFENEIVFQAVGFGLIQPTKEALSKYPELLRYTANNGTLVDTYEDNRRVEDDPEHALILKTGGAQIGASIYNFGRSWSGRPRQSGSFDNTVAYGNKDTKGLTEGFTPPGDFFPEVDSGDFSERYEDS